MNPRIDAPDSQQLERFASRRAQNDERPPSQHSHSGARCSAVRSRASLVAGAHIAPPVRARQRTQASRNVP
jgi:hypothetical protein